MSADDTSSEITKGSRVRVTRPLSQAEAGVGLVTQMTGRGKARMAWVRWPSGYAKSGYLIGKLTKVRGAS